MVGEQVENERSSKRESEFPGHGDERKSDTSAVDRVYRPGYPLEKEISGACLGYKDSL